MKIKISTSILLTLICTFFVSIPLIAQIDHSKAHRRYWYYRTRMINDFMKVGKNQGECIVFAERNNFISKSKIGPDQIDITNQYIMALALEYKLLSRGQQDTKETVYELFHLLWTINRLDLNEKKV